jgi:hypothetical protein
LFHSGFTDFCFLLSTFQILPFSFPLTNPAPGLYRPAMPDHVVERVRVRCKRKHPFRRLFRIALGTVLAVGLVYLLLAALNNQGSSPPPSPAIPDDDTSIQFK